MSFKFSFSYVITSNIIVPFVFYFNWMIHISCLLSLNLVIRLLCLQCYIIFIIISFLSSNNCYATNCIVINYI